MVKFRVSIRVSGYDYYWIGYVRVSMRVRVRVRERERVLATVRGCRLV